MTGIAESVDRFVVPDGLTRSILDGRCIAFVGAGFSRPAIPDWRSLLVQLASELDAEVALANDASALDFELIGAELRRRAGSDAAFERLVKRIVDRSLSPGAAGHDTMRRRRELLQRIPFKAILTTNFDPWLAADRDLDLYWKVLRADEGRWWHFPVRAGDRHPGVPVIKLHGDANGDPASSPLVLGRGDYRARVYGEQAYTAFIRAAFAQYTVLFLGVSFTDAYLNELRSETLQMLGNRHTAWGFATKLVDASNQHIVPLFREHESIEVLPMRDVEDFDHWLAAIESRTSARSRLTELLEGRTIVWIDPVPENNELGRELLEACKANVIALHDETELSESMADASLLITHFGFDRATTDSRAYRVLEVLRAWRSHPPVIVFAAPSDHVGRNRAECLRRGAWEYATQWSELYRLIEVLLSRVPGEISSAWR
jgi:CheY-like chemotaxis protein